MEDKLKPVRKDLTNISGKKFVDGSGNGWEFSLAFDNLRLDTNAASLSPGFMAAPGGFVVRAPLNGSWGFAISGDLKAHAWAGTQTTAFGVTVKTNIVDQTVIVPFNLGIDDISFAASPGIDTGNPARPELASAIVQAHARIAGSVLFPAIPVDVELARQADGSLAGQFEVTRELGLPDFVAVDEGAILSIHFFPFSTDNVWVLWVSLEGAFYLQFPDPIGRVNVPSRPFFSTPLVIPAIRAMGIDAYVGLARGPIPVPWPPSGSMPPPGTAQVPPVPTDFATPRDTIEAGILVTHVPYGAVLSLDYVPGPFAPSTPEYTYGIDADSTIWTGHYLTAEAFRYAATHSPEALERVRKAIGGLVTDFNVTTDVALQDHKYVVVPQDEAGYVFARSTILHTSARASALPGMTGARVGRIAGAQGSTLYDWTDSVAKRIERGACLYVKPSGGWKIGSEIFPTYTAALESPRGRGIRLATPEPVDTLDKPISYGSGCGNRGDFDSPISRDQYSGVFMGLAYAYALVPDIQSDAKGLIVKALDFLLTHNWNVPLPPDGTISTTFIGNFDAQLSLLRIGASVDPSHVPPNTSQSYQQLYARFAPASAFCWLPTWLSTVDPLVSYYKHNLGHAFLGPALFLETDTTLRANYLTAYGILRAATAMDRNAYFNLVDILVNAATISSPSASNPNLSLGDEIKSDLADWVTRWKDVKGANGMPRNATSQSAAAYQVQLWPNYMKVYTDLMLNKMWVSAYPLPLQDRIGRGTEFIWQNSPFDAGIDSPNGARILVSGILGPASHKYNCSTTPPEVTQLVLCTSEGYQEGPGVDFLLPYWLGVYLNVLPAQ